ncbi:MAG: hypothetical protein U9R79_03090 [Armatimonadota bacterium]|nr:hypothetical protein [Armatimonadota bacterium]
MGSGPLPAIYSLIRETRPEVRAPRHVNLPVQQLGARALRGEDFRQVVYEVLNRGYDYDLQQQDPWPMEPGRRRPVLTCGQRSRVEEEKGRQ